ncbi:unnamed protein product [Polarella glacialis]|uniref:Uncharacterized protein n=1 Tax=Polarella glacialis TaxID=89957 RepID=A0A813F3B0_POLGL|nr:unnamed protein product [Polarella glacialis]
MLLQCGRWSSRAGRRRRAPAGGRRMTLPRKFQRWRFQLWRLRKGARTVDHQWRPSPVGSAAELQMTSGRRRARAGRLLPSSSRLGERRRCGCPSTTMAHAVTICVHLALPTSCTRRKTFSSASLIRSSCRGLTSFGITRLTRRPT